MGSPTTTQASPGPALRVLDAVAARRWAVLARAAFAARRTELDALNVFPVPDGDTGTNLFLTIDGALAGEPGRSGVGLTAQSRAFARALLLTARGNSGVILSQIFRGLADEIAARGPEGGGLDGAGLARALVRADEMAWAAVDRPVEGTILSVSRAASRAGLAAGDDLAGVVTAVLAAARAALADTPRQLPALARAGVVDAGGTAYVVLLEALERVVRGGEGESVPPPRPAATRPAPPPLGGDGPAYEVTYLLDGTDEDRVRALRARLAGLGDSLVVSGGDDGADGADGTWSVHVHVDDVGAALEAGVEAGRPHRVRVERFADAAPETSRLHAASYAVVACAAGEGLATLFAAAGARTVPSAPRRRASAGQLLDAVLATGAATVLLLPNDGDTVLAADAAAQVAAERGVDVRVVRSRSAVEGLAALAVLDPSADATTAATALSEAAAATRRGSVTVADRAADTAAGPCRPGDALGLVGGEVVVVGSDLEQTAAHVVQRLLADGGEVVTLVLGESAPAGLGEAVEAAARRTAPHAEITRIYGGQPVHPLFVGVE
ncbi:DAK2 domain-containing protein [Lapillicoccus jejuensis]|uniref:DhaL domain-containing protein n=1 Tax=Lapillicoccus jejuensis TaxID=402171 RepID=A0A542E3D3_9MICO|nr:DAK2 domain-containing protein [Lapillicoccus jejuensis]TQJ09786.1 hypothetical protein FB458_2902 [Lapillicoccus jejuensis]